LILKHTPPLLHGFVRDEADVYMFFNLTPAVTGAFVVSVASEKCVRVYGLVRHYILQRMNIIFRIFFRYDLP